MSVKGVRKLSSVIIAQNEAPRIGNAIRSLQPFSDEIVVVDGGSRDGTPEIAEKLGCVVYRNPWPGYSAQRNFAADKAAHDWIFFIDADEVVGSELARALESWKSSPESPFEGYIVVRIGDFIGRWLSGQDIVRLYDKTRHRVKNVLLNEEVEIPPEKLGRLGGTLWHYGFRSISEHQERFGRYTDMEAAELYARGKRFSLFRLSARPPARFFQRYLLMGFWKMGVPGLAAALFWSYFEVMRELKLYEVQWRAVEGASGLHEPPRET